MILLNQISGLFPISGDELAYDFQLTDDVNAEGRLAIVAAIQAEHLRQLQDECCAAGLKVSVTVPTSFGSVELLRTKGIRDAAVVQIDKQGAAIDVVTHGVLRYSRWTAATRDVPGEVRRTFAAAGIEPLPILAAGDSAVPAEYHSKESTLAALGQLDLAKPPLNIELGEVKAQREAKSRANAIRVSGLILVAGLAAAGFIGFDRYSATAKIQAAVDVQAKKAATAKMDASKADTQKTLATTKLEIVSRGFHPAQRFWEVLAVLTNDAPTGVWLTGVSMERGRPFTVRGTAMNAGQIAAYNHVLATEERLRDVHLQFSNDASIDNRPVVQFSITGFPNGNVPLIDPPSSGSSAPPAAASTTATTAGGAA
jgi:hypothetical protein